MGLGHDNRLILVSVKPHPKPEITLLFLIKVMIILEPQLFELVFALHVIDVLCPLY